jgi:hypothetical protein
MSCGANIQSPGETTTPIVNEHTCRRATHRADRSIVSIVCNSTTSFSCSVSFQLSSSHSSSNATMTSAIDLSALRHYLSDSSSCVSDDIVASRRFPSSSRSLSKQLAPAIPSPPSDSSFEILRSSESVRDLHESRLRRQSARMVSREMSLLWTKP